jgi:hypothetical protein
MAGTHNDARMDMDCPKAPILRSTVYTRTLHRACEALGGAPQLAAELRVATRELMRWLEGLEAPPDGVFLAAQAISARSGGKPV